MSQPELRVVAGGFAFLEVPRWRDGRLWALDMYARQVLTFDQHGEVDTILDVPGTPTGLGWLADQRLVVALREGQLLRHDDTGFAEICDLAHLGPAWPNEFTIDHRGRIFIGLFGLTSGQLIRVEPDGSTHLAAADLLLPNGQALTTDGRTMLVAESAGQRITAFTVDDDGGLSDRRVWASFGDPATASTLPEALAQVSVWPDGISLDGDDAAWVANPIGHEVFRVREGGQITDRISTADRRPVACALGGRQQNTLYLCSAPPSTDTKQMAELRQSTLLSIDVGTHS